MERLIGWSPLGTVQIGPTSGRVAIGDVTLQPGADTLWVKVRQLGGASPWPHGFGLLSWQSASGRELGTTKVWGHTEGEVVRLGVGLQPVATTGVLCFEPRSYNLSWVKASGAVWQLQFESQSGLTGGAGGGVSGFAGGFVTAQGAGLELARVVFP